MSSPTAATRELASFTDFCGELRVEDGSSFVLRPFQKTILRDYFAGARETACILPKKNGKSTLVAAKALYHLIVTPDAECVIVAAARDQAEVVLRQARMFISRCEPLAERLSVRQRSIHSDAGEGRIRVLAADADTADGVIPTLVIVDELHRHRTADLYGVLRDGLGPRDGKLITISTAGANDSSPLGLIRQKAHGLDSFKRKGTYNYATSPSGAFAFHEWCLDPDDDVEDMALVKKANPAPWHTAQSLGERHDSETMSSAQWLRFACGIWTDAEEPWLDPPMWDDLASEDTIAPGSEVFLGVKVRLDESAVVVLGGNVARAHILPGADIETVEEQILSLAERYKVHTVAFDPSAFRRSAELLQGRGLQMQAFPTTPERMSVASVTLKRLIETKTLHHDGDLGFRTHVLAGTVKESERGWRLVADPGRPIAALIALVMAAQVAEDAPPEQEVLVQWA